VAVGATAAVVGVAVAAGSVRAVGEVVVALGLSGALWTGALDDGLVVPCGGGGVWSLVGDGRSSVSPPPRLGRGAAAAASSCEISFSLWCLCSCQLYTSTLPFLPIFPDRFILPLLPFPLILPLRRFDALVLSVGSWPTPKLLCDACNQFHQDQATTWLKREHFRCRFL
jgi:hypothetical protein